MHLEYLKYFITLGSFYDQCLSKGGVMYERDSGENGCYVFYSRANSKEYTYNKSKQYCEEIPGAKGSLLNIKGPKDDINMLQLLNGYVSYNEYDNNTPT